MLLVRCSAFIEQTLMFGVPNPPAVGDIDQRALYNITVGVFCVWLAGNLHVPALGWSTCVGEKSANTLRPNIKFIRTLSTNVNPKNWLFWNQAEVNK